MTYSDFHPEDVKAAIRKHFTSLKMFERQKGLPNGSVTDLLRGKTSRRVADAIDVFLTDQPSALSARNQSGKLDDSATRKPVHRLNRKAA
jgi:lambda repressor-like predicted transcriptional regulator